MSVSEKELLHIADLSSLELKEEEIQDYLENFQEIIDFSKVITQFVCDVIYRPSFSSGTLYIFYCVLSTICFQ